MPRMIVAVASGRNWMPRFRPHGRRESGPAISTLSPSALVPVGILVSLGPASPLVSKRPLGVCDCSGSIFTAAIPWLRHWVRDSPISIAITFQASLSVSCLRFADGIPVQRSDSTGRCWRGKLRRKVALRNISGAIGLPVPRLDSGALQEPQQFGTQTFAAPCGKLVQSKEGRHHGPLSYLVLGSASSTKRPVRTSYAARQCKALRYLLSNLLLPPAVSPQDHGELSVNSRQLMGHARHLMRHPTPHCGTTHKMKSGSSKPEESEFQRTHKVTRPDT